jgi:hypothetical protein
MTNDQILTTSRIMTLALETIILDARLQSRESMHKQTIDDYAEMYESDSEQMPPLHAFKIDGVHYLVDGFHRIEAAKQAGVVDLEVEVTTGTFQEAGRFICSANATHGLRRTNADKRRQVQIALETDPEWSDREIARHCGVSPDFVNRLRRTICHLMTDTRKAVRNGKLYSIDTGKIGTREPMAIDEHLSRDEIDQRYGEPFSLEVQNQPETRQRSVFNATNEMVDWAK